MEEEGDVLSRSSVQNLNIQDHVPHFGHFLWSNNCDFRLALVVKTVQWEMYPRENKRVKRREAQGRTGRKRKEKGSSWTPSFS